MRKIQFFIILLLISAKSFSQDDIKTMESNVKNLVGVEYVQTALRLSDRYLKAGSETKALSWAQQAYRSAKKQSNRMLMAFSKNREAKAIIAVGRKSKMGDASKAIEESLELNGGYDVELDKDNKLLLKRVSQIMGIEGPSEMPLKEDPMKAKQLEEEKRKNNELQSSLEKLNKKLKDNNISSEKQQKLATELASRIDQQKAEIQKMSDEQLKSELLLSQQQLLADSLHMVSMADSMKLAEQASVLAQKDMDANLSRSQRNLFIALAAIVGILAFAFFSRYRKTKSYNDQLKEKSLQVAEEKEKSDKLLLNILPAPIAEELKSKGKAEARHYDMTTVLFSDFVNFTKIAEQLTPQQLVSELDECFKGFDEIIRKHGIEKIKTIGDAYMCAGGIPEPDPRHPIAVVRAAMDMVAFMNKRKWDKKAANLPWFEVRVGINSGPVVAGVVGLDKFAYDIWGDTVNVAARLETAGEPGKINVSKATYELVGDIFECSSRGRIETKSKGLVEMFFVERELKGNDLAK